MHGQLFIIHTEIWQSHIRCLSLRLINRSTMIHTDSWIVVLINGYTKAMLITSLKDMTISKIFVSPNIRK